MNKPWIAANALIVSLALISTFVGDASAHALVQSGRDGDTERAERRHTQ